MIKKYRYIIKNMMAGAMTVMFLTACGQTAITNPTGTDTAGTDIAATESAATDTAATETGEESVSPEEIEKNDTEDLITHHNDHKYTHGTDGYYNLLEDGVEFELVPQLSGTCWLCSAACAMMTDYQLFHDGKITLEQYDLLNRIYDDDKEEGVFVRKGAEKEKIGGLGIFVVNELSLGFNDGLVLDGAISAKDWTDEEIKEGIKKYGALYIGITDSNKGTYDNYHTMNFPNAKPEEYDHSIAILGWDDHFPKENFMIKASKDGAWIAYNSNYPYEYFYISYDTTIDKINDPPLFMSASEEYSRVLFHDRGVWTEEPVITGEKTTTANVFKEKGTLYAVGTYTFSDDEDINIQIMTADMKECLYSMDCHVDYAGYHVFKLEEPQEVEEYAVAVTYPLGAPVEGDSIDVDFSIYIKVVSDKGQSFILIDDEWLDMSEKSTWDRLGRVTNNACIRALYSE